MPAARGKLSVTATPIGNLEDITLRALRVLKEADVIAAEDTRITRRLLTRHNIATLMVSFFEHNEIKRLPELIGRMKEGDRVALVSDAGTPGISDPGFRLVKACVDEGIDIEVIPGPSAAIAAISVSGLPTDRFLFLGFLPRKDGERRRLLESLQEERGTIVVYESPHRVQRTLIAIRDVLGDRPVALARELTKKFEEVKRGTAAEILTEIGEKKIKGEITIVIGGKLKKPKTKNQTPKTK